MNLNECIYIMFYKFILFPLLAEPILTIGTTEFVTWPDKWTILTADGGPAAQFEHTILITKSGAEILTTL